MYFYVCDIFKEFFRHQLQLSNLEDKITADNPVRFIDVFVKDINIDFEKNKTH
jgi:hypothetical protein